MSSAQSVLDFKLLFESAPGLFLVLAPDVPTFTILGASHAYLQRARAERAKIIGRGLFDVLPDNPDDSAALATSNLRASLERVLANKAVDAVAPQKYAISLPPNEGRRFDERFWSSVNAPVFSAAGEVAYILHRVDDATELVRAGRMGEHARARSHALERRTEAMELEVVRRSQDLEAANEELRRANEQLAEIEDQARRRWAAELEQANRELEALSYSVSHDLQAPLRAIDGFSKALLSEFAERLDERGLHYLERVRDGTQRMSYLIDDLLKLSRINSAPLRRERVDVAELARNIMLGLRGREPQRSVDVEVSDGLMTKADARLALVVFENLLGNAWKFTSKQPEARIQVGMEQRPDGCFLYVRDNGAGFDMQYAEKLFAPFQRLHHDSDFEGTGIGLATVRRVVSRHGGRIWAEAAVGTGATFFLCFGANP